MRKLASIQQIAEIRPIEGADAIEAVRINDWWCVAKKGEFALNDLCVYHEIDSLLPVGAVYDFLASRGTRKSELEDGTIVEGYRLRTIRLKGQLSQGLALPLNVLDSVADKFKGWFPPDHYMSPKAKNIEEAKNYKLRIAVEVGADVTEILGVHKYELPMNPSLRGTARGNFPSFARKSDQERCQNLRRQIWDAYVAEDVFQVTVKLDGSSMTTFKIGEVLAEQYGTEPRFGVCSRNLELKETEGNAFWDIARRDDVENKIRMYIGKCNELGLDCDGFVFQGELISPSIQQNFEGVNRPDFFVYNMFDIENQEWFVPLATRNVAQTLGLKHVPIVHDHISLREMFPDATQDTIIQQLLDYADGPSAFGGKFREGVVFKRMDGKFSFKAISNKYLLKEKD